MCGYCADSLGKSARDHSDRLCRGPTEIRCQSAQIRPDYKDASRQGDCFAIVDLWSGDSSGRLLCDHEFVERSAQNWSCNDVRVAISFMSVAEVAMITHLLPCDVDVAIMILLSVQRRAGRATTFAL